MRIARPYQSECFIAIQQAFRAGKKRVLVQLPTGSGKTIIFVFIAKMTQDKGGKTLILCNRDNLIKQTCDKYFQVHGTYPTTEQAGDKASWLNPVVVGSIQSMQGKRLKKWPKDYFKLVITDECFVAGTKVETPFGPRDIECIEPGDLVVAFDHKSNREVFKKVVRTFENPIQSDLMEISFSNGRRFICTLDHPIYSGGKYIPAKELTSGSIVHSIEQYETSMHAKENCSEMRNLRSGINLRKPIQERRSFLSFFGCAKARLASLLSSMQSGKCVSDIFRANDGKKSHALKEDESEAISGSARKGMEAAYSGRQRKAAALSAITNGFNAWMEDGTRCKEQSKERLGISVSLQTGYRLSDPESRSRDRRSLSYDAFEASGRQKEGGVSEIVRVESISLLERASNSGPRRVRDAGSVFNLEVEHCNNYFAEGILVHNCHGAAAKTFKNVLEHFENAYHVGFSATIERSDGQGIGYFYEDICYSKSIDEMIDDGWLVPFTSEVFPLRVADEHIRNSTGEEIIYDPKAFEREAEKLLAERIKGRKALLFYRDCASSLVASDRVREIGINSRHVDSSYMPESETSDALKWFASANPASLFNSALLSTGYDQPDIDMVVVFRLLKSSQLWIQMLGRALRPIANVDACADAESRKLAISMSAKPSATIVNIFPENAKHRAKLTDITCLVSMLKEDREEVRKKLGKKIDMADLAMVKAALEQVIQDKERKYRKSLEQAANAAQRHTKDADVWIWDILQTQNTGEPATSKQLWFLRKLGCKDADKLSLTKAQASRVIGRYSTRKQKATA